MSEEAVWREDLVCFVVGLNYNVSDRTGFLMIDDGGCCDMSGCIALFKKIDPAVARILTFSGDKPDTEYRLIDGEWYAIDHEDDAP